MLSARRSRRNPFTFGGCGSAYFATGGAAARDLMPAITIDLGSQFYVNTVQVFNAAAGLQKARRASAMRARASALACVARKAICADGVVTACARTAKLYQVCAQKTSASASV
jgi:hypothetical protein